MKRVWARRFHGRGGQSMVELALTLPVLLLLLCGILDFGWIYGNDILLSHCAREAARYASINASRSDVVSATTQCAKNAVPDYMGSTLQVTVTISGGDATVQIAWNANVLTPLGTLWAGGQKVRLQTQCTMQTES